MGRKSNTFEGSLCPGGEPLELFLKHACEALPSALGFSFWRAELRNLGPVPPDSEKSRPLSSGTLPVALQPASLTANGHFGATREGFVREGDIRKSRLRRTCVQDSERKRSEMGMNSCCTLHSGKCDAIQLLFLKNPQW